MEGSVVLDGPNQVLWKTRVNNKQEMVVDTTSPPPRPKVKSGQLHYHITRLDPEVTPQFLNLADIQHQKFDFQAAMMRIE